MIDFIKQIIDIFLNLNAHLNDWSAALGIWLYAVLFLIIFCETGLVVTPILPGDSLLFAVGALAASDGSPLQIWMLMILLCSAGIIGDTVNYSIGYRVGPKVFHKEDSIFLNKKYLIRAQEFYEKYGGKTIIIARFVPIIRTFAPFVAGIGKMRYGRFIAFNVIGGISWVVLFLLGGYLFGNQPWVKKQFHYVIAAIIIISVMPGVIEYAKHRYSKT